MNDQRILLVDDDNSYRNSLLNGLKKIYSKVDGVASGEEAIELIRNNQKEYQFAIIDHQLGSEPDGIETTRKLIEISPNIYPVIFSNVPGNDVEKYEFEALEAGAYRYIQRQGDDLIKITQIIQEIEQLEQLSKWIKEYFEARTSAPSLLTQLNIGMDIIDSSFKLWFMSERMKEITGVRGTNLPKAPCAHWHGYTTTPCPVCLVEKCLKEESSSISKIYLSPFKYRTDRKLFYLKVWAQPVKDRDNNVILNSVGKPLAVMESVQELSNTAELFNMTLDERLKIICGALYELRKKAYLKEKQFEYVRIFYAEKIDKNASFILKAQYGNYNKAPRTGGNYDLRNIDGQKLNAAEFNMKETGYGYWVENPVTNDSIITGKQRIQYIYWPIIENGIIIALIEAGGKILDKEKVEILQPYAEEVLFAIKDSRNQKNDPLSEIYTDIGSIELSLQQDPRSAEEQLKYIIQKACELTNSAQYCLRYRKDDISKLIRLKINGFDDFEEVEDNMVILSKSDTWSDRTTTTGVEILADSVQHEQLMKMPLIKMNLEQKEVLSSINQIYYVPLIFEGKRIGALGFHAKNLRTYNDKKCAIINALTKWVTLALHDYLIAQEIREKTEGEANSKASLDVVRLILHNLKTPLATARISFDRLIHLIETSGEMSPKMKDRILEITESLIKMNNINESVLRLQKPWQSRVEKTNIKNLLEEVSQTIVFSRINFIPKIILQNDIREVYIDHAALKVCLEVILQNSIDALTEYNIHTKEIKIKVRKSILDELKDIKEPLSFYLSIDIIDNGPGIPDDIKESLFKKMRSSKIDGIGIGLMHCKTIINASHGDIYYDETYKSGTKFTLILPYKKYDYEDFSN